MTNLLARIWITLVCVIGLASADEVGSKAAGFLEGLSPLTPKRIPMDRIVVTRCSIDSILQGSPHQSADMVVHANKVLIDYVRANPKGVEFPVGSVLVKEKFPSKQLEAKAILYTRMERVKKAGVVTDWKFSAADPEVKGPHAERGVSHCVSCHEDFEDSGFVSVDSVKLLRAFVKEAEGSVEGVGE